MIEHSGRTWKSLGIGPNGRPIWPVDEYLARNNHRPTVADRIRRLNPNGIEEGSIVRGVFHKPKSWRWEKRRKQCGRPARRRFRMGKNIVNPMFVGYMV